MTPRSRDVIFGGRAVLVILDPADGRGFAASTQEDASLFPLQREIGVTWSVKDAAVVVEE